nr:hypothetical protein StreXyl84_03630 [Streptomyces sp. Xyl84]
MTAGRRKRGKRGEREAGGTGRAGRRTEGAGMTGRQVLAAEAGVLGALLLVLLAREMPGIVREVRIWRMVGLRPGSRHRR